MLAVLNYIPFHFLEPQGSVLTTSIKVSTLSQALRSPPHSLPTAVLSIDDLYLPHHLQQQLAATHPSNPLIQHRGQPSTHDIALGRSVLASLRTGQRTKIPSYDKSAFRGQGDRAPEEKWECVNLEGEERVRVVVFEGWCVGFRPLLKEELKSKWEDAVRAREQGGYKGRLGHNRMEDVEFINNALREYDELTEYDPRPPTGQSQTLTHPQPPRRPDPHVSPTPPRPAHRPLQPTHPTLATPKPHKTSTPGASSKKPPSAPLKASA